MGYNISQGSTKFFISKDHFSHLLSLFKNEGYEFNNINDFIEFMWDDNLWEIEIDDSGNICSILIYSEKLSFQELDTLNIMAPCVRDGSYITISGEDGDLWRWVFQDGRCIEIHPTILWTSHTQLRQELIKMFEEYAFSSSTLPNVSGLIDKIVQYILN